MHARASDTWTVIGDHLRIAPYRFPGGVSHTTLVETDRHVVVFSPGVPLVDEARSLAELGRDVVLVAPSLGHTAGILAWQACLNDATVLASPVTSDRLRGRGLRVEVQSPRSLTVDGLEVLSPPGNTLGELWMRLENDAGVTWVVCDAFSNLRQLAPGFWLRQLQRLYGIRLGLRLGAAFRRHTTDHHAFVGWLEQQLGRGCDRLVPCHGEVDDGPMLAERLLAEARAAYG